MELAYGYHQTDSMTKIYERSNGPVVKNSTRGLKELQQGLIYCMGKVGRTEAASLDNPALVNNFIKRLPQKFCSQYHFQALNCTRKFDDLLKYLTLSIRATEHNPEVNVRTITVIVDASLKLIISVHHLTMSRVIMKRYRSIK